MKKKYRRPLLLALALIFLFESWLWDVTGRAVRWLIRTLPIERLTAAFHARMEPLNPVQTLGIFVIPLAILFPLKFVALYMLSQGSIFSGIATIIFAKLASFGATSFLFTVCKPKILQVRWVRWTYEHCLIWRAKAHALVKPYTRFIKRYLAVMKPRENIVGKVRTQMHKMRQ